MGLDDMGDVILLAGRCRGACVVVRFQVTVALHAASEIGRQPLRYAQVVAHMAVACQQDDTFACCGMVGKNFGHPYIARHLCPDHAGHDVIRHLAAMTCLHGMALAVDDGGGQGLVKPVSVYGGGIEHGGIAFTHQLASIAARQVGGQQGQFVIEGELDDGAVERPFPAFAASFADDAVGIFAFCLGLA